MKWPKPAGPSLEGLGRNLGRTRVRERTIQCKKGYEARITEYDSGKPTVKCNAPPTCAIECLHGEVTDPLTSVDKMRSLDEEET